LKNNGTLYVGLDEQNELTKVVRAIDAGNVASFKIAPTKAEIACLCKRFQSKASHVRWFTKRVRAAM
jgi:hypothetical protein